MSGIHIIEDVWFPPPPSFFRRPNATGITTKLSIVPYDASEHGDADYYDEHGLADDQSQNASGYAASITSSPFLEVEYLEGEYLNEFEAILKNMDGEDQDIYDSGVVSDEVSDLSDADVDSGDGRAGYGATAEPIIRIERLTESYIKQMTECFRQSMAEGESATQAENEPDGSEDEDDGFEGFAVGEQSSAQVATDVQSDNDAMGVFDGDSEMTVMFDSVHDFDGPEVVIGDRTTTPSLFQPDQQLTILNYKCSAFQPRVVLPLLPSHTLEQHTSPSTSKSRKQVSRACHQRFVELMRQSCLYRQFCSFIIFCLCLFQSTKRKRSATRTKSRPRKRNGRAPPRARNTTRKGRLTHAQIVLEHELALQQFYGNDRPTQSLWPY